MDGSEIARRFGLDGPARLSDGPVARGKEGAVWRLETSDGDWAVKVPYGAAGEDDVGLSTAFHEAAYAAGVPTPEVRRTVEGTVFADVRGRRVRLYSWMALGAPDHRLDPAVVGGVVAGIHRVVLPADAVTEGPLDPWYHEPVGADRWDELVALLRAAGAPFAGQLADQRDELVALERWIEPPETLQVCHRDLWADNVLPTADGGVCVIDWENSGAADPSQELGCVLFEFARADPGRARVLLDSYRAAGGPGRVDRPGRFSMLVAQLGNITATAAADWLAPNPRSPTREDAHAWIAESLDDPYPRERLLALLAAGGAGPSSPGP